MERDDELKINARGLSKPGPRMMVKNALARRAPGTLRVVVDDLDAVEDLKDYFKSLSATFTLDEIGDEYHFLVSLPSHKK